MVPRIIEDDLSDARVRALLERHLRGMRDHSPDESVHALDLGALRAPSVTLWTAWEADALLGCGALHEIDARHGEVKSMRTHDDHLRRGVAAAILGHLLGVARRRGYVRVSLETGSGAPFEAAHRLYERFGFVPTGPFATYGDDPFSRFFTLEL